MINTTKKAVARRLRLMTLFIGMLVPILGHGHNWNVHEKIADSAYQSSDALQTFLSENVGDPNTPLIASPPECGGSFPALEWLRLGSKMEDEQIYYVIGTSQAPRVMDHFYTVNPERTPSQVGGLTDWSEPPFVGFLCPLVGITTDNSFKWATDDVIQCPFGVGPNVYKWDDVRRYECAALTNAMPDARNEKMAMMFYSLGHVLHLNQDTSSPDHVRDAAHLYEAYFEDYGRDNCTNNLQWFATTNHHGWAYWQSQGFSKLLDFWDRNKYKASSSENLDKEVSGDVKLGLAEFDNGNFLGETALYKECYYNPSDKHYFPFPSLANTTASKLQLGHLAGAVIGGITLRDHKTGDRVYISKTGAGIVVTNHSVLNYLAVLNTPKLGNSQMHVTLTIHDNNVLQEYHEKLIPKAVEYSAGILDYFFRGTMDVTASWGDTNSPCFTNTVLNTSGQDFHGGSFFLFEETNGIRTLIQTNALTGTLTNGASMDIICPGHIPPTNKFLLVYQGTIGWSNNAAFDLVDSNICIAAARPWLRQIKTYYYQPTLDSLGLQPGATITTNLESDDFGFTPTAGNYEVKVDLAVFDDTGTIGDLSCHYDDTLIHCTLPDVITIISIRSLLPQRQLVMSIAGFLLRQGVCNQFCQRHLFEYAHTQNL